MTHGFEPPNEGFVASLALAERSEREPALDSPFAICIYYQTLERSAYIRYCGI